ncbi:hypothetical protein [Marinisporobacter balticus]|uniref:NfeD-like partner-binding protein n=1 Tax=Marinisporobacter balticus TaxID=2018667 RepID=A0A4R2KQ40_9FIRM|nr:hypothetical protein [Marinisporobacter balticus]TCO74787.1 NfeD-like partner-binding protein [Marinisporobacter balticus]
MILIYKITFITGILYAVVSLILGHLFDAIDFDGDVDFPLFTILPVKPITVVTFITVFGGAGIMCTRRGIATIFTLLISLVFAYFISFLVYRFVVVPLYKAQNTSAASQKEIIGLDATVKSSIMENGFGKISYVSKGNTYDSPAKHIKGDFIEAGTKVFIVDIKKHVYYVERKNFYYDITTKI